MIAPGSQTDLLSRLLSAARTRSDVIAHNVANVNTPGHKTLEVRFEEELAKALQDGSGLAGLSPHVRPGGGNATPRADGNDVDIDVEMTRLVKNEVLVELYAQLLSTQFDQYRSAISGQ